MLTKERLDELLEYFPDTGIFRWKKKASRSTVIGSVAGYIKKDDGYVYIYIDRKLRFAHRLAILHATGSFSDGVVDHINHNKSDNRLENLRVVHQSINARNRPMQRNNTSGYTGVVYHKDVKKWQARINRKHIGIFDDIESAAAAVTYARKQCGFHDNHGTRQQP